MQSQLLDGGRGEEGVKNKKANSIFDMYISYKTSEFE